MNILSGLREGRVVAIGSATLATESEGRGRVTIGIRPADLRLADADRQGALPLRIDYVEELGATRLLHGRVEGQPLVSAWPAGENVPEQVWLTVAPTAMHLFDPDSGQRLG